jgi:hypothetical protein
MLLSLYAGLATRPLRHDTSPSRSLESGRHITLSFRAEQADALPLRSLPVNASARAERYSAPSRTLRVMNLSSISTPRTILFGAAPWVYEDGL